MVKTFWQCGMIECRYNSSGKCIDEVNYNICQEVVKKVFGKRYDDFCEWKTKTLGKRCEK